jgi:hypothetical protein
MLRAAIDRLDDLQTRFLELCDEQEERRVAHGLLRIKPSIAIFSLGRWIKRYSFCCFALSANRNHWGMSNEICRHFWGWHRRIECRA